MMLQLLANKQASFIDFSTGRRITQNTITLETVVRPVTEHSKCAFGRCGGCMEELSGRLHWSQI